MSFFKETSPTNDAVKPDRSADVGTPRLETSDIPKTDQREIPRGMPDAKAEDISAFERADIYNSALKSFGLASEASESKRSGANEASEGKGYSQHLEKGDNGKYYDKETGRAYDSVRAWIKDQEASAKRLESIAQYFRQKADKEWARYKNAEQNGESGDEKRNHFLRSQEYYAKADDRGEKAAHIREKLNSAGDAAESVGEVQKQDHLDVNPPIKNKQDGLEREREVNSELQKKYPEEQGYEIIPEAYLRDKNGNIVRDPVTGEARRIDFVVAKDGKAVDSIEVTSNTADKTQQSAKESRIREHGGNFVKDHSGNLVEIPANVQTRIERKA